MISEEGVSFTQVVGASRPRKQEPIALAVPQHCLTKMSGPGWTRKYASELDAKLELYKSICGQCRAEEDIDEHSSIYDMLVTACGCEYDWSPGFTRIVK